MSQPPNPVFTAEYDHLRAVLVRARETAGVTQEALSRRMGRTGPHIALLEKGQRRLELLEFYKLAVALGIDPTSLAGEVFVGFARVQDGAG